MTTTTPTDGLEALRERVRDIVEMRVAGANNWTAVYMKMLDDPGLPFKENEPAIDAIMDAIAEYHRPIIEAEVRRKLSLRLQRNRRRQR